MNNDSMDLEGHAQRSSCLTELSLPVLIAGALAISAGLWLAISAVL